MVLTVSPQGQVTERLLLHPSVNNSGYIVKVLTHASTVHIYVAHTWADTHAYTHTHMCSCTCMETGNMEGKIAMYLFH